MPQGPTILKALKISKEDTPKSSVEETESDVELRHKPANSTINDDKTTEQLNSDESSDDNKQSPSGSDSKTNLQDEEKLVQESEVKDTAEGVETVDDSTGSDSDSSNLQYYEPNGSSDSNDPLVLSLFTKEEKKSVQDYLRANGPVKFLKTYLMCDEAPYNISQLILLLGFVTPLDVLNDRSESGETALNIYLHRAMKRILNSRARLDYFTTLPILWEKLEAAHNILVLTGAGISTSLGIPDFRSNSGLYARLEHLGLSDPQEVFDIDLFRVDPSVFYSVAKDILPPTSQYTPTHEFIKLLQDKGKLLRNYTQNIDNLEHYAGIEYEKIIQCHGSFAFATCQSCGYKCNGEELFDDIRNSTISKCPRCMERLANKRKKSFKASDLDSSDEDELIGIMKPDITFFGEDLPDAFYENLSSDLKNCDLLICIGTSLKVAPVSEIVRHIPPEIPQLYINKDPVLHCQFDITMLGLCDIVVEFICQKMKWKFEHEMLTHEYPKAEEVDVGYFQVDLPKLEQ